MTVDPNVSRGKTPLEFGDSENDSVGNNSAALNSATFHLPNALTERNQWVLWRYEMRDGKPTKVPFQANGKPASTIDPTTWASYEEVLAAYRKFSKRWTGIGYVFSADDPYCGIDLDDCIDDNGRIKPWAQPILTTFADTYAEISPSGRGVKIWSRGTLPGKAKNAYVDGSGNPVSQEKSEGAIEIYDRGRYFTVTGDALGAPLQIEDHQADVAALYARIAGDGADKPKAKVDLHTQPKFLDGQRHDHLVSVAAQFRAKGMEKTEILAAVVAINQERCSPPKSREEIESIVDWASRQPVGKSRSRKATATAPPDDGGNIDADQPASGEEFSYLMNETGNADRLFDAYGSDLAHCEERNGYMTWTDFGVWKYERFVLPERMAEEIMRQALNEAATILDRDERDARFKFASKSLSKKGLEAIVHLAKKKVRQVKTTDFDRDPLLLNCQNGTINLRTGELREHRKEDLLSKMIPIDFDPEGKCPLFLRFLYRIMGDAPDATREERDRAARLVNYLQRLFGCAATGKPAKLLVVCYGASGNNGKTTLLTTVSKALGENQYSTQINIESLMVDPKGSGISNAVNSDLSDLQGCRFVFSSEVERGQRLALSRVKYLTGLSAIKTRRLREDWITFPPTFKMFMDCNDRPVVASSTDPIWNRVKCIPFTVELSAEEIDTDLGVKLEAELPGILAWIVEGAKAYAAHGLGTAPVEVEASTAEYKVSSDRLKEFIEDCCHLNTFAWVSSEKLSQTYTEWCAKNGERYPLDTKNFSEQLKAKGCTSKSKEIQGTNRRGWLGIDLKPR